MSQSQAEQLSLSVFDKLVSFLQQQGTLLTEKTNEIKRLEALCTKNKIDCSVKETPAKILNTDVKPKRN